MNEIELKHNHEIAFCLIHKIIAILLSNHDNAKYKD
jgi:hypothetical protein